MSKSQKKSIKFWPLMAAAMLCLIPAGVVFPAEIMTNDGQKFDGKVLEEEPDYVLMEIENGVQVRIDKSQIAYFQREDSKKPYAQEYPVLGLTYGSPTVLNLVAGYYLADFGLKFSGAYWGGIKGIQADLSVKLVDDEKFLANFSLVGGAIDTTSANNGYSLWSTGYWGGTDWTYGGIGFDINYGGFMFELDGVMGNFPNPVALPVQIGYVERFD